MRKWFLGLLALVLAIGLVMPALADVNISGSYRIRGTYYDYGGTSALGKVSEGMRQEARQHGISHDDAMTFWDNRLRLELSAKISDNLSFFVQADTGLGYDGSMYHNPLTHQDSYDGVFGNHWGGIEDGHAEVRGLYSYTINNDTYYNDAKDIVFQRAYFTYIEPILGGEFKVGRQWTFWGKGLIKSMNENRIQYVYRQPKFFVGVGFEKWEEGDILLDRDDLNEYSIFGSVELPLDIATITYSPYFGARVYSGNGGDEYFISNALKIVALEKLIANVEFVYMWGHIRDDGIGYEEDADVDAYAVACDLSYDLDLAKVGLEFAYISGETPDNEKSGFHTSYWYSPFVIYGHLPIGPRLLAPDGVGYWPEEPTHHELSNCYFFKLFASAEPIENLEVSTAFGYIWAAVDRLDDSGNYIDGADDIGFEWDVVVSYKITDNLHYHLEFGYLQVGDYYDVYNVPLADGKIGKVEASDAVALINAIQINF